MNQASQANVIDKVLDRCSLVVYQTRSISTDRDTGNIIKTGAKTNKELITTFDSAALRSINAEKQRGSRLCQMYGTKVESLAAWLVPNNRVDELLRGLEVIKEKVEVLADELAGNIGNLVLDYANRHPEQYSQILTFGPKAEEVKKSTRILYAAYRVRPEDVQDSGGLSFDLDELHVQALNEFAFALKDAKAKPNGRFFTDGIKNVLGRIGAKARSLAFLHPIIEEVATTVEQCIAQLPTGTRFDGIHAIAIGSIIDQLMDPYSLLANNGFTRMETETSDSEESEEFDPADLPVAPELAQASALAF